MVKERLPGGSLLYEMIDGLEAVTNCERQFPIEEMANLIYFNFRLGFWIIVRVRLVETKTITRAEVKCQSQRNRLQVVLQTDDSVDTELTVNR